MPVEVELFDDLGAVAQDARGALDRESQDILFDRLSWFELTERHCAPAGSVLVVRAQEGKDRAWLFLKVEGRRAHGLASWYSLRFGPVTNGGNGARLVPALIAALRRKTPIAHLDLHPIRASDPLVRALRSAGWLVRLTPGTRSSWTRTAGMDFAAYWERRPPRLRNTAARKGQAAGLDISIHSRFDEAVWADYEDVYRRSWKPREGSPAFLRALAEQEGAAGTLRIGIASKDGRPVAAQIWLVERGKATIHKLAHAQDARPLSPGTLLTRDMFRHAIDVEKVECIDFGLGEDAYKADWVDESDEVGRLVAFDLLRPAGWGAVAAAAASKLVALNRKD